MKRPNIARPASRKERWLIHRRSTQRQVPGDVEATPMNEAGNVTLAMVMARQALSAGIGSAIGYA
jgi:hypothetical protein